jgi:hypothetical protein
MNVLPELLPIVDPVCAVAQSVAHIPADPRPIADSRSRAGARNANMRNASTDVPARGNGEISASESPCGAPAESAAPNATAKVAASAESTTSTRDSTPEAAAPAAAETSATTSETAAASSKTTTAAAKPSAATATAAASQDIGRAHGRGEHGNDHRGD